MKTLEQACVPRESVFKERGLDTVYNLDELAGIDPHKFFEENFITQGMEQLLSEAFKRLEGKGAGASGTYLLSQSMGGGKTHNLIALALLAKFPQYRQQVMGSFYQPGPLGAVRVVAFTGRKTHTPFGLWGEIAEQLNRKEVFNPFYSPLQPPGSKNWVELLRGEPLLILLDELPPYFEAAKAIPVGATHLDSLTTTALANLLVAVSGNDLPNVCVVVTDLSGTAYHLGGAAMSEALEDLQLEVGRSVVRIDPVRLNTNELYEILRTRLFSQVPDASDVEAVADGYAKELEAARLMDITTASPDQLRADIVAAYPFHPAIRDLYARFRENPGFQQTRALIRLMRLVAAELWETGEAKHKYLVGAQDLDLHSSQVMSEIRQINSKLENAIAHDIAAEGGSSVAEQIDGAGATDAQDAACLLFLSSLSQAVNPILGLDRSEVAAYLAHPGRDLNTLRQAIDQLQTQAWYLHATRDGKLFFKDTENLVAKMETYTKGQLKEKRESELRARLNVMFDPKRKDCYQEVRALPALDQVQLTQDKVLLVVFRPSDQALVDIGDFFSHQQYKNRALFLTGISAGYEVVLQRAAEVSAINLIIAELRADNRREDDPQLVEAENIRSKKESQFYQACRETFQALYYPSKNGLTPVELEPKYVANEYKGEDQIIAALEEVAKFRKDTGADTTFPTSLENKLWPEHQKEVQWGSVKQRAAQDPSWLLHHPRALDDLKAELVRRDIWRENGEYVERGPFPKPATSVTVQLLQRSDETGEALLRVRPLHGDTVYWGESGPATTASPKLDFTVDLRTKAVRLSFLAMDSTGDHATGDPMEWTNSITLKHRFFQKGDEYLCELASYPAGQIRYTTDGSSPEQFGLTYGEPFAVPGDSRFILATASADGVKSEAFKFQVPPPGERAKVVVDPAVGAVWLRTHRRDDTYGSYELLSLLAKYGAEIGGLKVAVMRDTQWAEFRVEAGVFRSVEESRAIADLLHGMLSGGNLNIEATRLRFACGQDLLDLVAGLKTELQENEVKQP